MNLQGKRIPVLPVIATMLALTLGTLQAYAQDQPRSVAKSERPNFLVIVADDMGYSDLGSYGGEINTPVPRLPAPKSCWGGL